MSFVSDVLSLSVELIWSTPLVLLLVGGGAYLLILSRALPLRFFLRSLRLLALPQGGTAQAGLHEDGLMR